MLRITEIVKMVFLINNIIEMTFIILQYYYLYIISFINKIITDI